MSLKAKNDLNFIVLRYRWPIMIAISLFVIFVEYIEHIDLSENWLGGGFLWETIVFGILMPVSGGLLLSVINDRTKINTILARIDRQRTLKNALLSTRDWDELVTIISQIPHTIFPTLFGDAVYIFNPELSQFNRVSSWFSIEDKLPSIYPAELDIEEGFVKDHLDETDVQNLYTRNEIPTHVGKLVSYSLPIVHLNNPIAILRLLFLDEHLPNDESLIALNELVVDIALAIQNFQYQTDIILQSAAVLAERQRIARQLHDTLAQDLAFLRLKLEQLMYDDRSQTGGDFGNELYRLYKTADHSYEQVRNSLRAVSDDHSLEFTTALYESANTIAENANFQVELIQEGSPAELSAEMQRKILYIMREVLRNIGKHAHANLTKINIRWENDCVQIDTTDDGKGFNIDTVFQGKQNYGLNIIEEVVAELQGRYDLQSTENDGTRIHFWFPTSL